MDTDDIPTAQSLLQDYVTEHDNYVNSNNIDTKDESFTAKDNRSLHHALEHLDAAIQTEEPEQKQATINALEETDVI